MFDVYTFPKVSIIISTYNGAKYIGETIQSICAQTYPNWELIIVDDGSEDNTFDEVAKFTDERIQIYKAGRIGINGRIKNIGLSKISGELIAFIDHDDLWAPAKLEKQVAALEQYPEAGFCLTGGYNFKIKGEPLENFYKEKEGVRVDNVFLSIFRSEVAVWTQALLVRRQCIESAGGFNETSIFSDPEFIFRLAYHFKAVILYEALMCHRLHDTNYTRINWIASHKEGIDVIRSYAGKKMLPVALARDTLFRSYSHFGEKCIRYKEWKMAISSFFDAWKQKPFSIVPLKKMAKTISYVFRQQ